MHYPLGRWVFIPPIICSPLLLAHKQKGRYTSWLDHERSILSIGSRRPLDITLKVNVWPGQLLYLLLTTLMKYNKAWRRRQHARGKARKLHLFYALSSAMFKAGIFARNISKPNWSRPREVIDLHTRPLRYSPDNTYHIAKSRDDGMMNTDASKHDKNMEVLELNGKRIVLDKIETNVKHMLGCLYVPYKPHSCSSLSHTHNHR